MNGQTMSKQHGQALPVVLIGIVLAILITTMLINTGNRVVEKTRAVHIADAAALSGANYAANHLNTLAYLNRAMITNHIATGHMVSYVSWVRYVSDLANNVDAVATLLPPIKKVTTALKSGAQTIKRIGEISGTAYLVSVDQLNAFYSAVQAEASAEFPARLDATMQQVVNQSDHRATLNEDALSDFLQAERSVIHNALSQQRAKWSAFISAYHVQDRGAEIIKLTEAMIGQGSGQYQGSVSDPWLTDRSWGGVKSGGTRMNKQPMSWYAKDRLRVRFPGSVKRTTVATGSANSQSLYSGYRGIRHYHNLSAPLPGHYVMPVVAATSISQSEVFAADAFDLERDAARGGVTGLAIAHVEFVRPRNGFRPLAEDEYANLFQPFWRARLVGSRLEQLTQVHQEQSTWRHE